MTPALDILFYALILTFAMVLTSAVLRTRMWSPKGLVLGAGNRDNLPEATPLMGRADRAAKNMLENMVIFGPLALMAHVSHVDSDAALLGSQVFLVSRLAYYPIYLFGIPWIRTVSWTGSVVGMGIIALPLF